MASKVVVVVVVVVSDFSPSYLTTINQNNSNMCCNNCIKLKSELQIIQDELKSALLIIDLLQEEINSTEMSKNVSTNYVNNVDNESVSEEHNDADLNTWIQVRISHSNRQRK
jgi:hypothetical protein